MSLLRLSTTLLRPLMRQGLKTLLKKHTFYTFPLKIHQCLDLSDSQICSQTFLELLQSKYFSILEIELFNQTHLDINLSKILFTKQMMGFEPTTFKLTV